MMHPFQSIGTDRHNMVEIPNPNSNYPVPWENSTMWKGVELVWKDETWTNSSALDETDIAVVLASGGYYECYTTGKCTKSMQTYEPRLNRLLNNIVPSFGTVLRLKRGTYHYICSRNNNFTNRSQKGMITVTP